MSDPIAVIGGGITGLAAAHELLWQGYEPTLFESTDRVGGKIRTTELAGHRIDEAADAFLARVPWAIELCTELGLADELVSPAARDAYIWSHGQLHGLPSPQVLGIPLDPTADGGPLSDSARQAALDDLARTADDPLRDDDTIGSLVRRRLGNEIFETLVDPLIGSINAANCDELSVHSSAPQIAAGARANPSLIRGLADLRGTPDPDAPVFYSLPGGMERLVDALADRLEGRIRLQTRIDDISHSRRKLRLSTSDGDTESFKAAVLAAPAWAAAPMVSDWSEASRALAEIEFVSVVLVTMVFKRSSIDEDATVHKLGTGASGFLVPRNETPMITACSLSSQKWAHLDGDHLIVRVSLGHAGADAVIQATESDIIATVTRDLSTTLDITADPLAVRISRWRDSFPQYHVGHVDRVAVIDEQLAPSGIFTAGASIAGIGIPACIHQGRTAARDAIAHVDG